MAGWSTDFTATYSGVSGSPHDYVYASTSSSNGDLNGDGRNGNDLIYVPRSAYNTTEIQFRAVTNGATVAQQQAAFEQYILNSPCLSEHRGQILPRNSCKQPFLNQIDLAIRQTVPAVRGQRLSLQADITNFGNLINKNWGQQRVTEATLELQRADPDARRHDVEQPDGGDSDRAVQREPEGVHRRQLRVELLAVPVEREVLLLASSKERCKRAAISE